MDLNVVSPPWLVKSSGEDYCWSDNDNITCVCSCQPAIEIENTTLINVNVALAVFMRIAGISYSGCVRYFHFCWC